MSLQSLGNEEEQVRLMLADLLKNGPMNDVNMMPDQMPNEMAKYGNYPAQNTQTLQGLIPSYEAPVPQRHIATSGQVPGDYGQGQGAFRSNRTGDIVPLGSAQPQQSPQGPEGDWTQAKVETAFGTGVRVKGDPNRVILGDGRIVTITPTSQINAQRAAEKESMANQKVRAEIANLMKPAADPDRPKLKQGEVYGPDGTVRAVPGSAEYVKQRQAHEKDWSSAQGVNVKLDNAMNKAADILGHKGFESNFGGYNALASQYLPGDATDVRNKIEGFKSDLKGAGLELMRTGGSIGQMTQQEWPIVEGMLAKLSPTLSEDEARTTMQSIVSVMSRIKDNANEAYDMQWSGSQYHRPTKKKAEQSASSSSSKPTIQDFMAKARAANPGVSGAELEQFYYQKYGGR